MEILAAMTMTLKQWRGERKTEEVATLAGVTPAMWSRWENLKRRIPAERVVELERLTGIPREELRPDVFSPSKADAAA